jgi:hypothetical protein
MKRLISAMALVTLSVAACGGDDDDDDNGGNAGTSGTAGTSSSEGGQPASGEGGAPPLGNVTCDPEAETTCQNETDCPFVESGEARLTAGMCGQTCLFSGNMDEACPVECMLESVDMTPDCADCYADAALCGIENCAADCQADPEAEVCQTCIIDSGCRDAFNDCSGLEQ